MKLKDEFYFLFNQVGYWIKSLMGQRKVKELPEPEVDPIREKYPLSDVPHDAYIYQLWMDNVRGKISSDTYYELVRRYEDARQDESYDLDYLIEHYEFMRMAKRKRKKIGRI